MKVSREFKIGLIAILALALLIWGVNYLKGTSVFKKTTTYHIVCDDITGLIESAVVYLNGYKVGHVSEIHFDADQTDQILVKMELEKRIRLPRNTSAVLKSSSLISGSKDIYLEIGSGPGYYEEGDTLGSEMALEMFDFIEPVVDKIESLVISVDSVLTVLDASTRDNIRGGIEDLRCALASLKSSLQPDGTLSNSFANLESVSNNLKENNREISQALTNLSALSDSLKQADIKLLIAHLDQTFTQTSLLFEGIRKGEGTAGQLIVNDSLYRNLNHSLASLDSLLVDLKENPGRYVQVSVFGKKDK